MVVNDYTPYGVPGQAIYGRGYGSTYSPAGSCSALGADVFSDGTGYADVGGKFVLSDSTEEEFLLTPGNTPTGCFVGLVSTNPAVTVSSLVFYGDAAGDPGRGDPFVYNTSYGTSRVTPEPSTLVLLATGLLGLLAYAWRKRR